jgi:hypothetical protein
VSSSDIRITSPRYIDAGQTVVCTFTIVGAHDGPLGPLPATGKEFAWVRDGHANCWADVPCLPVRVGSWLRPRQQFWQQSGPCGHTGGTKIAVMSS